MMNQKLNNWSELIFNSLEDITSSVAQFLPNILGAVLILIFGWLFTKLILFLLKRIFKFIKLQQRIEKLKQKSYANAYLKEANVIQLILSVVKFILYIIIISIVFEALGWDSISKKIIDILDYLPKLISGLVIFIVGISIAGFIKKSLLSVFKAIDLVYGKIISQILYYTIAIIVTITSLNQAGVDTSIVTNNLTIILAAFLLTITLALGLGSREVVNSLLLGFYSKKRFHVGQKIKLESGVEGKILAMDSTTFSVDVGQEIIVVPISKLSEQTTRIIKEDSEESSPE